MKEINTLEEMLVEVRKIFPDAKIKKDKYEINDVYFIDCGLASIYECKPDRTKGWDFMLYDSIKPKNPQDILDIIKAIYNCGKPEKEKMNINIALQLFDKFISEIDNAVIQSDLNLALYTLCSELSKYDWISVRDRLPDAEKLVLIKERYSSPEEMLIGWINDYGDWIEQHEYLDMYSGDAALRHIINKDNITHWMPLPPAPEDK